MNVSKLRKTLMEYDFEILNAKSELALIEANVQKFARSKKRIARYTEWRIAEEKTKTYIQKLEKGLENTLNYLDLLLVEYGIKERKVFKSYYLKQMSIEEISQAENLEIEKVADIIERLKKDFEEE